MIGLLVELFERGAKAGWAALAGPHVAGEDRAVGDRAGFLQAAPRARLGRHPPECQNWKRTPSFIAIGSSAAMMRSLSPTRKEKFVTAFELKTL